MLDFSMLDGQVSPAHARRRALLRAGRSSAAPRHRASRARALGDLPLQGRQVRAHHRQRPALGAAVQGLELEVRHRPVDERDAGRASRRRDAETDGRDFRNRQSEAAADARRSRSARSARSTTSPRSSPIRTCARAGWSAASTIRAWANSRRSGCPTSSSAGTIRRSARRRRSARDTERLLRELLGYSDRENRKAEERRKPYERSPLLRRRRRRDAHPEPAREPQRAQPGNVRSA